MLIIFDLDGTLIDSKLDLAHAVNATLREHGRPELPEERIYSYVGDGAPVLLRRAFGPEAPEGEVARGLEFFIAYYRDHCLDFTTLYPGIRELLDGCRAAGWQMAVLTNKPVRISQLILEKLGLHEHFVRVYGGNSFAEKKPDPMGVLRLLEETGETAESTAFVGDSAVDVRTARNAGVPVIGVTYGFQPEGLETERPDWVVDRAEEVWRVLQENFGAASVLEKPESEGAAEAALW
jgi:phosphoglycolate phosphatase